MGWFTVPELNSVDGGASLNWLSAGKQRADRIEMYLRLSCFAPEPVGGSHGATGLPVGLDASVRQYIGGLEGRVNGFKKQLA